MVGNVWLSLVAKLKFKTNHKTNKAIKFSPCYIELIMKKYRIKNHHTIGYIVQERFMNEIYLHTDDIMELNGKFQTKYGTPLIPDKRMFGYFMQGANIVKIAYTQKQAETFLNNHKGQVIEPIYFYVA